MWNVFSLSQEMGVRPSDLLGVTNDYEAYCLDEAVVTFGVYVQSEVRKVGDKKTGKEKAKEGQKLAKLNALLNTKPGERKFANPVATR